ncbi:MAG: flippase-like domain-containing protein [Solirubrobacterales bacterium]|nr:flippase-like domain-containing protein [Solirubrobacterales bacterium]
MRRWLNEHPLATSAVAVGIAGVVVLVIARATGADAVGHAFEGFDAPWVALLAGASLLTYPAYMLAYRSIAGIHGHGPMALPLVARLVVAGFGPFSLCGGFGIDQQALRAVDQDERSTRVRVIALGVLEWAVLAPLTCVVAIVLLIQGENVMRSLLWPWVIAVPLGFAFGLWASSSGRIERISNLGGKRREWLAQPLEGVGVLHQLIREPGQHIMAWLGTMLYWVADIASFYGALRLFGLQPDVGRVIIAYATGYAATRRSLPLGGAGITEFLMTYALYWVRLPLAPSLAAVLAYRVFNLVIVAAPALIAHQQLRPLLNRRPQTSDQP